MHAHMRCARRAHPLLTAEIAVTAITGWAGLEGALSSRCWSPAGYIDSREFEVVITLLKDMANVHTAAVGRSKQLIT
jgi:hypothetical protein